MLYIQDLDSFFDIFDIYFCIFNIFFFNFEFSYSEFFSGRFDTSGSKVPRLVPEILSQCAFCDGGGGGGGAAAAAGIGDSRSLMGSRLALTVDEIRNSDQQRRQ